MPKQVEPCLWCGDLPCTCNGPAVKPKRKIKPKPKPETTETAVETAASSPDPSVFRKLATDAREQFDMQESRIEREALANLVAADLLAEEEVHLLRDQKLIDLPRDPDVEARLLDWRKRRDA